MLKVVLDFTKAGRALGAKLDKTGKFKNPDGIRGNGTGPVRIFLVSGRAGTRLQIC